MPFTRAPSCATAPQGRRRFYQSGGAVVTAHRIGPRANRRRQRPIPGFAQVSSWPQTGPEGGSLRTLILVAALCAAGGARPALAQQAGPVAPVLPEAKDETPPDPPRERVFPLWKSLLGGREFMPPVGLN